jgi:hypothetical protein
MAKKTGATMANSTNEAPKREERLRDNAIMSSPLNRNQ